MKRINDQFPLSWFCHERILLKHVTENSAHGPHNLIFQ